MSIGYRLKVNDTFHFEYDSAAAIALDAVSVAPDQYQIISENLCYDAKIQVANFQKKSYEVLVNNKLYTVSIANDLDQLIKELGFDTLSNHKVNEVKAPMPGLILEINVEVGQTVKENDNLIILGAMKMENSFQSPRDGVVKAIAVAVGDAVDKGQLLVELE